MSYSAASPKKRVQKACEKCRLRKTKCNGLKPCDRCVAGNSICSFGSQKNSYKKSYPEGYVEMLEGQQRQLVAGLQTLYSRTVNRQGWIGEPLAPVGGDKVSIHQILERLDTELDFDTMLPEGTLDDSRRDPGTPRLISRSQSGSPSSQARQLSPDIAAALFPPGTTFHDPDLERRHLIQHRHDTDNDNNAAAIEPLSLPARLLQSLELPPHPLIPPFNLDYSPLESLSQPTLPQRRLEQALQAGIDPAELLLSVHP